MVLKSTNHINHVLSSYKHGIL